MKFKQVKIKGCRKMKIKLKDLHQLAHWVTESRTPEGRRDLESFRRSQKLTSWDSAITSLLAERQTMDFNDTEEWLFNVGVANILGAREEALKRLAKKGQVPETWADSPMRSPPLAHGEIFETTGANNRNKEPPSEMPFQPQQSTAKSKDETSEAVKRLNAKLRLLKPCFVKIEKMEN